LHNRNILAVSPGGIPCDGQLPIRILLPVILVSDGFLDLVVCPAALTISCRSIEGMNTFRHGFTLFAGTILIVTAAAGQQTTPTAKLTLKSTVELAVRNSRDLQLAKLEAGLAGKTVDVDRAQFRPNLYTGSGYEYSSGFPLAPGGGVPAAFELSYQEAIFNPLARGRQHADEERAKAQTANLDSVRDSVMVRAATAYLELSKVRHALDLLRNEQVDAQKIGDLARERIAGGYELPIEQTRADLNSARVQQRIAHEEGREDALEDQLRDMLGLVPDQPIELVTEDLPPAAEQPIGELVAQAVANSPDVRQAEAEQRAKADILRGTRNDRWPTIDLVGDYAVLSNTNHYTEYFNKFSRNNVNIGVQVTIPVYAARASATISQAQADVHVAEVQAKSKKSQVEIQVRSQAHLMRELEMSSNVARLDFKLAQQNLEVIQAQADQGRAALRDLEQAHLTESDKWLAFLDAEFQRQQAELALLQATGQVSKILQ
jgi:outer membrane protein TolC